jgi:hypothetical protein
VLCVGTPYNFAPSVDKVVHEDIVEMSSAGFTVVVTYDDDHRLDTTTFDNDDIVLTGNASYDTILCSKSLRRTDWNWPVESKVYHICCWCGQ